MQKIKNLFLIMIVLSSTLAGFALLTPSKAEAALCFTETAPLQVMATTHTCPAPTASIVYRDTAGNVIPDANTLPMTRCFSKRLPVPGFEEVLYEENDCANLELLRANARRANCENGGGVYTPSPGGGSCACAANFSWNGSECVRGTTPGETHVSLTGDCQGADTNGDGTIDDANAIDESNCGIIKYLVILIKVLSGIVGVVVVISIIVGGLQYSMAGSDAQKIAAAKERIRNAIIALLLFIFTFSFLNYLVPGGVL